METRELNELKRVFDFDWVIFDAVFVALLLAFNLTYRRRISPVIYAAIITIQVYRIDAVIWWNSPAGDPYPPQTMTREYFFTLENGARLLRTDTDTYDTFMWYKHGCDFMMLISYGLAAFSFRACMDEHWIARKRDPQWWRCAIGEALLLIGGWFAVGFASHMLNVNQVECTSIRYMTNGTFTNTNMARMILVSGVVHACVTYLRRETLWVLPYCFVTGMVQGFAMEFPLYVFGVRPLKWDVFILEVLLLCTNASFHQYMLYVYVFPILRLRAKDMPMKLGDVRQINRVPAHARKKE